MSEFDPRSTTDRKDSELDGIIRPQQLDDFTGQKEIVSNLEIYIKAAKIAAKPWTTRFSTALRASERPPSRTSSRTRWGSI